MIRRKPIEDDEESAERWLVSYADFITLLFAFFVVMYAISSVNTSKYSTLTTSMETAFTGNSSTAHIKNIQIQSIDNNKIKGTPQSLVKPLPLSYLYQEKLRREREQMTSMGIDLSKALSALINQDKLHVLQNNRGIRIDIHDSLLFNAGSAELNPSAIEIMREIAFIINQNKHLVQVEGHTDNTPVHNDLFFSNWELSALRASSVVRLLSQLDVAEQRLSAIGFGATQPVSDNETLLGKAKNRRVSIMILYESDNNFDVASEIKP